MLSYLTQRSYPILDGLAFKMNHPFNYEYDVFLSYSRAKDWPKWVSYIFMPIFDHWLTSELGRDARIFVDTNIENGASWPETLDRALSKSAILVPLWTKNYFSSDWCTLEFTRFRARENIYSYGTFENPARLIHPAVIHDGKDFPREVGDISYTDLSEFVNVRMASNSLAEESLSLLVKKWVLCIVKSVRTVPECDPSWKELSARELYQQHKKNEPRQLGVPRFY
jgi:hypothetical protein